MLNNRDIAKKLIDQIPDDMLPYIIHFLLGASIPSVLPKATTASNH